MKKLLIIIILLCFGIAESFAQSVLKVRLADSSQFHLSVDGRYFNRLGSSITVGDLPARHHFIQIYVLRRDRWGRGYEDEIFEGRVKTHEGMATLFVYDYNADQTSVTEEDMSNFPINNNARPHGQHFREQYPDNNGNENNEAAQPAPLPTLTQTKMDDLKTQVAAKVADLDKMALLKDALKDETITTRQVSDIMDWFVFESAKVNFAKWAYGITLDKENFTNLENKFQYKESQDDLDSFIKSQK